MKKLFFTLPLMLLLAACSSSVTITGVLLNCSDTLVKITGSYDAQIDVDSTGHFYAYMNNADGDGNYFIINAGFDVNVEIPDKAGWDWADVGQ